MRADSVEQLHDVRIPLRNEPVQARSTARLATLLDAGAAIVDEIGYERLTTAMVAERAGASIGTVYRYFPDRIALLQALGSRNLERVLTRSADEVLEPRHENWFAALSAALDVVVAAFRDEPGFRSLRVGDVIDLRPAPTDRTFKSILADRILDNLLTRYGVADSARLRFLAESVIEVSDTFAARAFARDVNGDQSFLDTGSALVYSLLVEHFGEVPHSF